MRIQRPCVRGMLLESPLVVALIVALVVALIVVEPSLAGDTWDI
jgi:hypothetical protein